MPEVYGTELLRTREDCNGASFVQAPFQSVRGFRLSVCVRLDDSVIVHYTGGDSRGYQHSPEPRHVLVAACPCPVFIPFLPDTTDQGLPFDTPHILPAVAHSVIREVR